MTLTTSEIERVVEIYAKEHALNDDMQKLAATRNAEIKVLSDQIISLRTELIGLGKKV